MLGRKKRERLTAASVQTYAGPAFPGLPLGAGERQLYKALRESVPIIDAALYKLRRLLGDFTVTCRDPAAQAGLEDFLAKVQVNAAGAGIGEFVGVYFEDLLTYGNAVGEMVLQGEHIGALYNAGLDQLDLEEDGPLGVKVYARDAQGRRECPYPQLLLVSALNPEAGRPWGVSVLRGLPFVSQVLLQVYHTLGVNWERLGNVKFAVTCKPDGLGGMLAPGTGPARWRGSGSGP